MEALCQLSYSPKLGRRTLPISRTAPKYRPDRFSRSIDHEGPARQWDANSMNCSCPTPAITADRSGSTPRIGIATSPLSSPDPQVAASGRRPPDHAIHLLASPPRRAPPTDHSRSRDRLRQRRQRSCRARAMTRRRRWQATPCRQDSSAAPFEARHVAIQTFDFVELTHFIEKHVHNHIAVVEQHPLLLAMAFGANR